jgi:hypothetical protein
LLGEGTSGAGNDSGNPGFGGSGGANGTTAYLTSYCQCGDTYYRTYGGDGGAYGGGGGIGQNANGAGGVGAVRIIWPGTTRSFPSTNTGDL